MNIGGVGSGLPSGGGGGGGGRFFHAHRQSISERLLRLNLGLGAEVGAKVKGTAAGGEKGENGNGEGVEGKLLTKAQRLVPNRKKEEERALERIKLRGEIVLASKGSANSSNKHGKLAETFEKNKYDKMSQEDYATNEWEDEFIYDALMYHNGYRKHHGVPPLKICTQLCSKSQAWANHLAHTNMLMYDNDKTTGQNIFCRLNGDAPPGITAQDVVAEWYNSNKNYSYDKPNETLHIKINSGNFTQLVWKSTKVFGIARAKSRHGKVFVVACYKPAGNMTGAFHENVLRPLRKK